MADQNQAAEQGAASAGKASNEMRVGFCQECGQALTVDTLHRVGQGVFCTRCATLQTGSAGWQQVHGGAPRSGTAARPRGSGPNPGRAAVLGCIPGVGAMYNGQYAKGAMHLVVFVVLLALADNVNWVFYWLVWGWVFYQIFDAYHTARAKRDHEPLPNPFGWNDLADRLTGQRVSPPMYTPSPASPRATAAGMPPEWPGYHPPPPAPRAATPEPAARHPGDNPYAAPYTTTEPKAEFPGGAAAPVSRPPTRVPYEPTYVGPSLVPPVPPVPQRRFPVGAVWLIGLGLLFLFGNLLPGFHFSGQWFAPLLLAAVAVWSGFQRWESFRTAQVMGGPLPNFAGSLLGPVLMLCLATLLALQFGGVLALRRSWPVLLVVSGVLSLLQRLTTPRVPAVSVPPLYPGAAAPPPPSRSTSGTGSYGL